MALVTTRDAWEGQQERDRLQNWGLKRQTEGQKREGEGIFNLRVPRN